MNAIANDFQRTAQARAELCSDMAATMFSRNRYINIATLVFATISGASGAALLIVAQQPADHPLQIALKVFAILAAISKGLEQVVGLPDLSARMSKAANEYANIDRRLRVYIEAYSTSSFDPTSAQWKEIEGSMDSAEALIAPIPKKYRRLMREGLARISQT